MPKRFGRRSSILPRLKLWFESRASIRDARVGGQWIKWKNSSDSISLASSGRSGTVRIAIRLNGDHTVEGWGQA